MLQFLVENLAYQPVPLLITRQVVVQVPGEALEAPAENTAYYPIYAWQTTKESNQEDTMIHWQSDIILAPGDLASRQMGQMPTVRFRPIFGVS